MEIKQRKYYFWLIVVGLSLLAISFGLDRLANHKKVISHYDPESYKSTSYRFDDGPVRLVNGISTTKIAESSALRTIKYFGNELFADINHDSLPDVIFLLTENSGGSGTFYYVVGAIATKSGYVGTNAVFLGDRIAPMNINLVDGYIAVNYSDRKPKEPMTASPSVGVTKYLRLANNRLIAIEKEGEKTFSLSNPKEGTLVTSPMLVSGTITGSWFFEGSFGITLIDDNGKILASAPAQADGEWMTVKGVQFNSSLVFEKPETKKGLLIFEKDNPSGMTKYDRAVAVPVVFSDAQI